MECDSKTVDDSGDSATKHVLDYYKKYSLNKELPKYFSGTSVSYLPEIKDVENPEVVVNTDINIVITEDNKEVVTEEPLDTSRASSVTSNRKLEWDNGADIGYNNYLDIKFLRKSSSLPLLTESKQKKMNLQRLLSNTEHSDSQSSSDDNVKLILVTHSSSSESPSLQIDDVCLYSSHVQPEEKKSTSSSSNVKSNVLSKNIGDSSSSDSSRNQRIKQFANELLCLKKKIGVPDAHSTPKYPEGIKSDPVSVLETPEARKSEKTVRDENKPSTSKSTELPQVVKPKHAKQAGHVQSKNNDPIDTHVKYRNVKVINLSVVKPMTVECICYTQQHEEKPKDPLMKILKSCTNVGVQTDSISEQELIQMAHNKQKSNHNQSLLFFEYPESDKTISRSTQTNSIIASNCDSFEFFKNSPEDKNDLPISNICNKSSSKDKDYKPLVVERLDQIESTRGPQNQTLRRSQRTEDLRTVPCDGTSHQSSEDFCLGNVVSVSQLDNLGNDIEKSISLLQKLLKSKKYDPATKKRYIKKIVKKITESKYLEESSTSSDLFFPKKSKAHSSSLPSKMLSLIDTDSSDEDVKVKPCELKLPESSTDSKVLKNTLQSNLPWGPANNEKVKSPPRKKFVFKTFTQDFLPNQNVSSRDELSSPPEIIPTNSRDTRKQCFTLTNNEFSVKHKPDETKLNKSPCGVDNASLEQQHESTSTSKSSSYKNWKEDKTLSEKRFEQRSIENGNGDCLVQLAERERKYQIKWIDNEICHLGKLKGLLEKPASELYKPNVKKTTTVYTVSEESDAANKKSKKLKHEFVIETQLGAHTAKDMCYQIGNKKYTVHNSVNTPSKNSRPELGVVDVVTNGNTTNIKVSSFCKICKRAPCICVVKKPFICQDCKSDSCICRGSKKMATNGFKENNICRKCKRTCDTPSMESMLSGKTTCLDCHETYCSCMKMGDNQNFGSNKHGRSQASSTGDEYAGTFVPLKMRKSKSPLDCNDAKYSTFPYTSKDKAWKKVITSLAECTDCGGVPCTCPQKDFAEILTKNAPSGQNEVDIQCGSLKKVFENCSCTTQSKCHCGFVQKLIKHFDIGEIPTDILKDLDYYDKKTCKTEGNKTTGACHNVGIQVEMEGKHLQAIHRPCGSQTEDCPTNCDCIGIQVGAQTKNQISQRSAPKLAKHTTTLYCQPTQVSYESKETLTENNKKGISCVEKGMLTENDKKGVSCVEKATNYSTTKIEDVKCSENKNVACSATQVDTDTFQTCTSKGTSNSKYSKGTYTKGHVTCTDQQTATSADAANITEQNKSDSLESKPKYKSCHSSSESVSLYNADSSRSVSEESSLKIATLICICCKKEYTPENIVMRGRGTQNYPLCKCCIQRKPILTSLCYAGPQHVCNCYQPDATNMFHDIERTVNEVHKLECCNCIHTDPTKNQRSHCRYCQLKISQSRRGIAYTLTLENETARKVKCKQKKKKPPLEEIRMKVPCSYSRKRSKDKENFSRKDSTKEKVQGCSNGAVINNNHPKENNTKTTCKARQSRNLTLQEYLRENRPKFIDSAEYRRQNILASRSERELHKDELKLRFLDENINNNTLKKNKLFTEREMKEITKQNYKKLPEIKQRISKVKQRKLRFADKFIMDVFTSKIHDSVLQGKNTFPIDRNIVYLSKT